MSEIARMSSDLSVGIVTGLGRTPGTRLLAGTRDFSTLYSVQFTFWPTEPPIK